MISKKRKICDLEVEESSASKPRVAPSISESSRSVPSPSSHSTAGRYESSPLGYGFVRVRPADGDGDGDGALMPRLTTQPVIDESYHDDEVSSETGLMRRCPLALVMALMIST